MPSGSAGAGGQGQHSSSYTGGVAPQDLAQMLSELARSLESERGLEATLDAMVAAAIGTIPGARYAGLTVVRGRRAVETRAASDDLVRWVDRLQHETGQGPCLDAAYEQQTIRVSNLALDDRWPDFTARVAELGVRSMLSIQLFVAHDNLGALNLYSPEADAFGDESEQVGLLFAAHAAVAMAGAQQRDDMDRAIFVRDVIGQAKGILMERYRLTADHAFALLVQASQHTNTKLAQIARTVAETGQFTRQPEHHQFSGRAH